MQVSGYELPRNHVLGTWVNKDAFGSIVGAQTAGEVHQVVPDDGSQRGTDLRSPSVLAAIGVAATLVLALAVVLTLLLTGSAKAVSDNAALIGALVALGGVLTAQMVSIALDDRRSQEARELEAQRAHEAALQNYFAQVGTLLIERPLRGVSPNDNLRTVVRAQTLAELEGLDPDRKRILLQFLYESMLIDQDEPQVSLQFANLSGAYLSGANLGRANLSGANLSGANLIGVDLREADLREADLSQADLIRTDLTGANLREADLSAAKGITTTELARVAKSLEGAIMPDGSKQPYSELP
jgi:Pentapeptide repeats (8 copies)